MLRTYCSVLLFLCAVSVFSQTHIFYIDLSSRDSRLRHTSDHILALLNNVEQRDNLLFFISNGGRPFIANKKEEVSKILEELVFFPRPIRPMSFYDIDTINAILSQRELIRGINDQDRSIDLPLNIYFYSNPKDPQLDDLVSRFLLSNRLLQQKGLLDYVSVIIYFDCPADMENSKRTIRNYQSKYKDYEIHLF